MTADEVRAMDDATILGHLQRIVDPLLTDEMRSGKVIFISSSFACESMPLTFCISKGHTFRVDSGNLAFLAIFVEDGTAKNVAPLCPRHALCLMKIREWGGWTICWDVLTRDTLAGTLDFLGQQVLDLQIVHEAIQSPSCAGH